MGSLLRYSIDGGLTYQSDNQFTDLSVGVYDQIRISADSTCFFNYPDAVTIGQSDSIQLTYRLKSPSCETCRDGQLTLTLSGGVPPYRISLNGSSIDLITRDLGVGSYVIIVTDANLCTKTAEFTLEMLNQIPNVITTNGDGINDLWSIPLLKYYPDAIVRVFSTAAQLVFKSPPGYPVPWDGRYNGSLLPMGTYYYVINLGPGEETRTGYLTILR
jgi:gliding motility-associated-like protein